MIFLALMAPIFIDLADVTVVACDADWMDRTQLEQMARAELSEIEDERIKGGVWIVDSCTEESARIRVFDRDGQRERTVPLEGLPKDLKLRTVVLAFGDLAREREDLAEPNADETSEAPTPLHEEVTQPETGSEVVFGTTAQIENDFAYDCEKPPLADPPAEEPPKESYPIMAGAYFRWFPLTKTMAPEARIGFRTENWRFALGGYGMGWRSPFRRLYLSAFTATIGPTLWRHQGAVTLGLDALMELGAVVAIGKSHDYVESETKFNVMAGAHVSFWLNLLPSKPFQPLLMLEAGWLRGANVFVDGTLQGGFEGPSIALCLAGQW